MALGVDDSSDAIAPGLIGGGHELSGAGGDSAHHCRIDLVTVDVEHNPGTAVWWRRLAGEVAGDIVHHDEGVVDEERGVNEVAVFLHTLREHARRKGSETEADFCAGISADQHGNDEVGFHGVGEER